MTALRTDMSPACVRHHVLLVSKPTNAKHLCGLLSRSGFVVAVAGSSLAALNAATRTQLAGSQVIVVDLGVGESEALCLIEQLRAQLQGGAAQVIAVGPGTDPMTEVACYGAGADDFVTQENLELVFAAKVRAHSRTAARTAQLLQLAVRDELTGAHNRRGTVAALNAELDRSRRSGRPVSLLLLDIDSFKQINDTYGHNVGDQVLIDLADRMDALLRSTDIVGRLGGDEFVVVLPEVDADLVDTLAMRVREAARDVCIGASDKRLSISIGLATYQPNLGTTTSDELIGQADAAMYERKRRKRRTTRNEQVLAA